MSPTFMSFFRRDDLAEENVVKKIHNCLDMILNGDYFSEKHVGVAMKREFLKSAFIVYIQDELKRIVTSGNPYRDFREKIIKTIKVDVNQQRSAWRGIRVRTGQDL